MGLHCEVLENRSLLSFSGSITGYAFAGSYIDGSQSASNTDVVHSNPFSVSASISNYGGTVSAFSTGSLVSNSSSLAVNLTEQSSGSDVLGPNYHLISEADIQVNGSFSLSSTSNVSIATQIALVANDPIHYNSAGGNLIIYSSGGQAVWQLNDLANSIGNTQSLISLPAGLYTLKSQSGAESQTDNDFGISAIPESVSFNFQIAIQPTHVTTTTVLASTPNPSVVGHPITFTATVSPNTSNLLLPTGNVTFFDGSTALGTAAVDGTGKAVLLVSNLAVGDHPAITAIYGGDLNFTGSTSAAVDERVNSSFVVTSLADSGSGSLRDILGQVNSDPISNGADQITFANGIQGQTIFLTSALPSLTRDQVALVGPVGISNAGSAGPDGLDLLGNQDSVSRVTVSNFVGEGIAVFGVNNSVAGCVLSGNHDGLYLYNASGTMVGGVASGDGNTIINNSVCGINVILSNGSIIQGNWIGTDSKGDLGLRNGSDGIFIHNNSGGNVIGGVGSGGNTIAYNGGNGVTVRGVGTGNAVRQDLIYGNTGFPIQLGNQGLSPNSSNGPRVGPNNFQNSPIITWNWQSNSPVQEPTQGTLNSTPNTTFGVDIYENWVEVDSTGSVVSQNAVLLNTQSVTTDQNGNALLQPVNTMAIQPSNPSNKIFVTIAGTATDPNNNTSEFGLPLSPTQVIKAYGGTPGGQLNGQGQTIAIVVAYNDPYIAKDLTRFDQQFGNNDPALHVYNQAGSDITNLISTSGQNGVPIQDPTGTWESEESLDVEWAHAIATGSQIDVIETASASLTDLMAGAIRATTLSGVSVVSMSWGNYEGSGISQMDEAKYDSQLSALSTQGITFVAASGDDGAPARGYPAFSPYVVAVGGTTLSLNADASYNSEAGWGYPDGTGGWIASGGGPSNSGYESEPSYQLGVQHFGQRMIPDVALIGGTEVAVADSYVATIDNPGWIASTGTSLAAPCWAGLFALVNQGRAAAGRPILDSSSSVSTLAALYTMPSTDFHTSLGGQNGTTTNNLTNPSLYNEVTGLGTPVANLLVTDLVNYSGVLPTPIFQNAPTGSILIATFRVNGNGPYAANVDWGDGSTDTSNSANSPVTVQVVGQQINVFGSHAFAANGPKTVATILTGNGPAVRSLSTAYISTDASSLVTVARTGLIYNRQSKLFNGTMTLTNVAFENTSNSLDILIQGLTSTVTLANASVTIGGVTSTLSIGKTSLGISYIHVPVSLVKTFAKGSSLAINLSFLNPTLALINFTTKEFEDPFTL